MSEVEAFDNFEEEQPQVFEQAPVVQPAELPDIKLFGRWSSDDIHISDISVSDYIAGSSNSYAIKKKDELERVAKSNR
ncbi:AAEL013021-PA [Aedes aegypti]|uniref:AAEL013021-PA n=1 Tax=Aedes aegypti TaxID=7159 RepID=Q16KF0_AEDAE|nr:AAEL013021-PA [Aedes aegypti]